MKNIFALAIAGLLLVACDDKVATHFPPDGGIKTDGGGGDPDGGPVVPDGGVPDSGTPDSGTTCNPTGPTSIAAGANFIGVVPGNDACRALGVSVDDKGNLQLQLFGPNLSVPVPGAFEYGGNGFTQSPDHTRILTITDPDKSGLGKLTLINVAAGTVQTLATKAIDVGSAFGAANSMLYLTNINDTNIGTPIWSNGTTSKTLPSGATLFVKTSDSESAVARFNTERTRALVSTNITTDSGDLLLVAMADGSATPLNTSVKVIGGQADMALNGSLAAAPGADGALYLFDLTHPDAAPTQLVAATAAVSWPRFSPTSDRLVYYSADGIFSISASGGSTPKRLGDDPTPLPQPAIFTPDGRALLFGANAAPSTEPGTYLADGYLVSADGSTPAVLLGNNWAPLAVSFAGGHGATMVNMVDLSKQADINGLGDLVLFTPTTSATPNSQLSRVSRFDFLFSADGTHLAAVGNSSAGTKTGNLSLMDATGRNRPSFPTSANAVPYFQYWFSLDGSHLAYIGDASNTTDSLDRRSGTLFWAALDGTTTQLRSNVSQVSLSGNFAFTVGSDGVFSTPLPK